MNPLFSAIVQSQSIAPLDVLLAATPVLLLIVLLGFLKISGDKSAVITLIASLIIAVLAFSFPVEDVGALLAYSISKAMFPILSIVVTAIFSYNVLVHTQKMEVIKAQFSSISSDKSIQVLLLTWGFGGLLEGMAGFGTAVAIPAAILISLGFKPIFAATASLVANSVPTAFGAIGIPVKILAVEASLDNVQELSSNIVLQLSPLMFIIPLVLLSITNFSWKSLPRNILLAVLVGGISLVTQYFVAMYMGAETPAIMGSLASIVVIVLFGKITEKNNASQKLNYKISEILSAWSIYALILFLIIITSPLCPLVREALQSLGATKLSFPIHNAIKTYEIAWFVDPGFLLLIGSVLGGLIQRAKIVDLFKLLGKTIVSQRKTAITVCSLISLSTIMDSSGMIFVLGLTLATTTGMLYPFFAPMIGCLGTFLTGSDTSSNILFGKLQATVAGELGVDKSWLAAANTAGATGGKMISPQSIAIATSACNEQGNEGLIMKKAMPFAICYIIIAGLVVYFFA